MKILKLIRCWYRGQHSPRRHMALQGFTCMDCGHVSTDLSGMGYGRDSGYVPELRRLYDREGGLTRTAEWEPTRRGW